MFYYNNYTRMRAYNLFLFTNIFLKLRIINTCIKEKVDILKFDMKNLFQINM